MKSSWSRAALSALLAAGAAAAAVRAEVGVTDKEILVGSCAALSGNDDFIGKQTLLGARAFLNSVNDGGGVFGRKIQLLSYDHKYDPEVAIECFGRLQKEGIFAAAFLTGTPMAVKIVPMADKAGIPLVGFYAASEFLADPVRRSVFAVKTSYRDEISQAADRLWTERGVRKFGAIYQNDVVGSSILKGVKQGLEAHSAAPVATASYERGTFEHMDRAIAEVRAAAPEAVFLAGPYKPSSEVVKRIRALGWKPIFVGYSGIGWEGFIKEAGELSEGVVLPTSIPLHTETKIPAVDRYLRAMKKYFPAEKLSMVGFEGFVDAIVFAEGLKRAGKDLTRDRLIDALDGIRDLDIGLGRELKVNYSPTDHFGLNKVLFVTIQKDGSIVRLESWTGVK